MGARYVGDSLKRQAFYLNFGVPWWLTNGIVLHSLIFIIGCVPTNETLPANTQLPSSTATVPALTHFTTPSLPTQTNALDSVITVSGYVIEGGDTTPAGLVDVPRIFKYRIEKDDGSVILITYSAYPPSPSGDESRKFRLKFHAGEIQIEDYLQARGIYDGQTNTLIIAEEGHFIETFPQKP
jgi:hypothetical protein